MARLTRKQKWRLRHLKKGQINIRVSKIEKQMIIALMYLGHYNTMSEAILSAVAHELEDLGQYKFAKEELKKELENATDERFKEFL